MFKKVCSMLLVVAMIATGAVLLTACDGGEKADLKVGAILVGDETEGYTLAHMNGLEKAVKNIEEATGKKVSLVYKKVVREDNTCYEAAKSLE